MKNFFRFLILFLLFALIYRGTRLQNHDALWNIVSHRCSMANTRAQQTSPCLKIDRVNHYAIIRDKKGGNHFLLIPTVKLSGIEDVRAMNPKQQPYFYDAWESRSFLPVGSSKAKTWRSYSFALNSAYGRTQNQFHIHLSCLDPKVYQALESARGSIGSYWKPLPVRLESHAYIARTLPLASLKTVDPLLLLRDYVHSKHDNMTRYGLEMIVQSQDQAVLLATRYTPWRLNFASVEELQDSTCALLKR